ncbi:MAG: hypothetical protein M5U28_09355 [Sandaracinaceae bacterium]|nr:hypothetical protein [Sandaracinaceae bacterium]
MGRTSRVFAVLLATLALTAPAFAQAPAAVVRELAVSGDAHRAQIVVSGEFEVPRYDVRTRDEGRVVVLDVDGGTLPEGGLSVEGSSPLVARSTSSATSRGLRLELELRAPVAHHVRAGAGQIVLTLMLAEERAADEPAEGGAPVVRSVHVERRDGRDRVVVELSGPAEFRTSPRTVGPAQLILPGVRVAEGAARELAVDGGDDLVVRAVRVRSRDGGAVIDVERRGWGARHRHPRGQPHRLALLRAGGRGAAALAHHRARGVGRRRGGARRRRDGDHERGGRSLPHRRADAGGTRARPRALPRAAHRSRLPQRRHPQHPAPARRGRRREHRHERRRERRRHDPHAQRAVGSGARRDPAGQGPRHGAPRQPHPRGAARDPGEGAGAGHRPAEAAGGARAPRDAPHPGELRDGVGSLAARAGAPDRARQRLGRRAHERADRARHDRQPRRHRGARPHARHADAAGPRGGAHRRGDQPVRARRGHPVGRQRHRVDRHRQPDRAHLPRQRGGDGRQLRHEHAHAGPDSLRAAGRGTPTSRSTCPRRPARASAVRSASRSGRSAGR